MAQQDLQAAEAIRLPIVALRRSVAVLSSFFAEELNKVGARASKLTLRSAFDESVTKAVGILVREHVCPGIIAVLNNGYRRSHLFTKRHLWDLVEACALNLRQSARDLGGVAIPDAVEMVSSLTDPTGRARSSLSKLTPEGINDIRVRMFICHCLNQQTLAAFFESLFDPSPHNAEFLKKFYNTDRNVVIASAEGRDEVLRIVRCLSQVPFVLSLDAEIW